MIETFFPFNIAVLAFLLSLPCVIHKIDEGFIGIYYRGGALLSVTSKPGIHMMIPLLTSCSAIKITQQTDEIKNVPCGTNSGDMIYFERIDVVNTLDVDHVLDIVRNYTHNYDRVLINNKIHYEVNKFCNRHSLEEIYIEMFDQIGEHLKTKIQNDLNIMAPGLKIDEVLLTKPKLSAAMLRNYQWLENERIQLLIERQRQEIIDENYRKKEIFEFETQAILSKLKYEQIIVEKELLLRIAQINKELKIDDMELEKQSPQPVASAI